MSRTAPAAGLAVVACLLLAPAAGAGPLRHGDAPAELAVAAVGDRTIRVTLAPLDEAGKPRPGPASTALVGLKPEPKLRVRDLAETKEVEVGRLRVRVK